MKENLTHTEIFCFEKCLHSAFDSVKAAKGSAFSCVAITDSGEECEKFSHACTAAIRKIVGDSDMSYLGLAIGALAVAERALEECVKMKAEK